jgi:hypothetical protein
MSKFAEKGEVISEERGRLVRNITFWADGQKYVSPLKVPRQYSLVPVVEIRLREVTF